MEFLPSQEQGAQRDRRKASLLDIEPMEAVHPSTQALAGLV